MSGQEGVPAESTPPSLSDHPDGFALHKRKEVQWVQAIMERDLTLAEQALVLCACAYTGQWGPYNVLRARQWQSRLRPIAHIGARVSIDRGAATFDSFGLTRLVFIAHDLGVRASIGPCGGNRVELQVHLRSRSGSTMERHPTLDQAVAAWADNPFRPSGGTPPTAPKRPLKEVRGVIVL